MTAMLRSRGLLRMLPAAAIALLLALLTLNRLGASDVCGGSEAAMAVYVQQMVAHHQLLFPLDNCTIPMYKPPLYHWTAAGLATLLHQGATPFSLRLPSALYAIGGALLTMAFAATLLGSRGAILAGLILCASYQYVSQARIGLVDMTLTFCETLSLFSFFYWFALARADRIAARTSAHYLFAVAMGSGVLAKGPVGALLPGAAVLLFLLMEGERSALARLFKPGPLILGAALASSWYLACAIGHRYNFLHLQIDKENFGRFFGSLGAMSPWYYVQPLLLNSLPLSLFVPAAVIGAMLPQRIAQRRRGAACPMGSAADESERIADGAKRPVAMRAARLLAIFWIVSIVFFELAAYKRRAYLLPLWPASAFLLAWWTLERVIPFFGQRLIVYRAAIAACLLLAAANFLFIPAYELHGCGAPFTVASMLRWPSAGFAGESPVTSGQTKSYRGAAAQINRLIGTDPALYTFGFQEALEPLIFYLGRCAPLVRAPDSAPPDARIIAPAKVWARLSMHYPSLTPIARIPYDDDPMILLGSNAQAIAKGD